MVFVDAVCGVFFDGLSIVSNIRKYSLWLYSSLVFESLVFVDLQIETERHIDLFSFVFRYLFCGWAGAIPFLYVSKAAGGFFARRIFGGECIADIDQS